jgi:hypothetical protein
LKDGKKGKQKKGKKYSRMEKRKYGNRLLAMQKRANRDVKRGFSWGKKGVLTGQKGANDNRAAIAMHIRSNCDARTQQLRCTYAAIATHVRSNCCGITKTPFPYRKDGSRATKKPAGRRVKSLLAGCYCRRSAVPTGDFSLPVSP